MAAFGCNQRRSLREPAEDQRGSWRGCGPQALARNSFRGPCAHRLFPRELEGGREGLGEFHYDALDPEEIKVGRWVDVGPLKLDDTWMHFPAHNQSSADALKDPLAKEDFVIRVYSISASVTSGAELSATTKMTLAPRLAGQIVLIFDFDSNLRVESVKDAQGTALSFYQARETKDRYQSYGDYVAVILSEPMAPGKPQTLEFRYSGKRAIRKAGNGNYFCESSGWYPELSNSFATRADFDMTFRSPKNSVLVATGAK